MTETTNLLGFFKFNDLHELSDLIPQSGTSRLHCLLDTTSSSDGGRSNCFWKTEQSWKWRATEYYHVHLRMKVSFTLTVSDLISQSGKSRLHCLLDATSSSDGGRSNCFWKTEGLKMKSYGTLSRSSEHKSDILPLPFTLNFWI